MTSADVVVVGAGVIGSAIAHTFAQHEYTTILADKQQPGREASAAAAGILAVASGRAKGGPLYRLKQTSQALYPALIDDLQQATGIDVEYQTVGVVCPVRHDADEEKYRALYELRKEQRLPARWLSAGELQAAEPALDPSLRGGVHFSGDHHLHNGKLAQAWAQAAVLRGAELKTDAALTDVRLRKGRVQAVRLGDDWIEAGTVVVACGSWSGELGALFGIDIPVRPAKGQMLAVRTARITHVIACDEHYLVPRKNGEVVIGSTVEFVGHTKDVMLDTLQEFMRRSEELVPGIRGAPLSRFWAGLRPYSPTRRPILCRAPGLDNVVLATGHHRNGIVLAPMTGRLIYELVTTGRPSMDLTPFGLPEAGQESSPGPDESPDEAD